MTESRSHDSHATRPSGRLDSSETEEGTMETWLESVAYGWVANVTHAGRPDASQAFSQSFEIESAALVLDVAVDAAPDDPLD